ncbi:hypothetical protein [Haloferax larsenii]|uniref:hypothetical protein n=1 Tax=Haloferax larsenii TaxID=302484 RepID=UPI0009442E97|nr:hypothetical protein [Haloferax larsenii]
MSSPDTKMEVFGISLRNVMIIVLCLFLFHLGRGWARGLVEGNYTIGVLGLILALGPIVWLLVVIREAYF